MKLPRETVSIYDGGGQPRCQCPLYYGCDMATQCKLREDYMQQYILDYSGLIETYPDGLFAKVYKFYRHVIPIS